MYYSNEDVDRLDGMLTIPGGDAYLKTAATGIGKMLVANPSLYKTFGVYWWAVKEALRAHYPDKGAWFLGAYDDPTMRGRAWHGSLFRTVLAGAFYHAQHPLITSAHDWTDDKGADRSYTLIDYDAGF